MKGKNIKIVVFVPETHSDAVRKTAGVAGVGKIGNYSFCNFSSRGVGRYRPGMGARPKIGEIGKMGLRPE